jgi:hypothetical protein
MGRGMTEGKHKTPLPVLQQRHVDERTDFERCVFLRVGARVGRRVADDHNFTRARSPPKFVGDQIRDGIHASQRRHIFPMPLVENSRRARRLVDFGTIEERKIQMRADFRADDPHHFVHARHAREVLADRGEQRQVHSVCLRVVMSRVKQGFHSDSLPSTFRSRLDLATLQRPSALRLEVARRQDRQGDGRYCCPRCR